MLVLCTVHSVLLHPVCSLASCIHIRCVCVCFLFFCFLSRQRYCSLLRHNMSYDITTCLPSVSVCVHANVCMRSFVCECVCLCLCVSVCPAIAMAAIAGSGSCASLCAKYIWSVSYFEFKLKNFSCKLCSAFVLRVWETNATHTGRHVLSIQCMCLRVCTYMCAGVCVVLQSNNKNYLYI